MSTILSVLSKRVVGDLLSARRDPFVRDSRTRLEVEYAVAEFLEHGNI